MEPSADTREAGSVEQLLEAPAKKRIGSGLELGLAAGLLSLPGTDAMEQHSLEHRALDQRGQRPPATPDASLPRSTAAASCSDVSCSSTQVTGAAMHQSLRGEDLAEVVGNEEGPGEQKRRQRDFMELLHSKIQQRHDQRQQQGGTKDGPSLAAALASGARRKKAKDVSEFQGDPRVSLWEPPQSPFGLIEEQLFGNPWKLLVACILLNKTSVVRKVIWKLFELMPTPEDAMHADVEAVRELIEPLGLAPKRAPMLIRFSKEYVEKQWTNPVELHGVGQYAADAYNIFCRGDWRSVSPKDKDLLRYHQWLTETGGEGTGLSRDAVPEAAGGEEGAQTSAAWCLSAVLLFMSLVLLRQAFERPLGAKDSAPGPSSTPVGAMQPHSLGTSLVYSTLPADSLTSTLVHQDAPSQGEGGPALMWIALKVLMIVLPFCILLRIVVIAREVRMRHSRGAAAEQSRGAVLWLSSAFAQ
ncbi:DNA glycosylase [Coccomyxa subellipsoidea C-169]|uniref:Methyl-CpG-binding domain protein 4 n=1 Tax=Coccomyxa subellipsoidea (strain C-169) TaxID=574566 RepID=I0Z1L2_COCSC|nr:DNA glycosylase [Coccomyxa subellipsoidea C-169]EIE24531.1 DNA glycosylase [Coccomyxa subellipsoidea C-169]|eukprot:XP_005649075.1 DNA glycosylase [Coccomyxa subellipsoidea C-169]